MNASFLMRLLTIFLSLFQKSFVLQSIIYRLAKTHTSNLRPSCERIDDPVRKAESAEIIERLRPDSPMSESTRPDDDESSISKTQSNAVQVSRRHHRVRQEVELLFNDYFSRVPPEHKLYALTLTLHDFKYFNSGSRIVNRQIAHDECAKVAKRFHHLLCQKFVRKNNYNNPNTAHLVPHAIFTIEHSAKMSSHLHAILSVHPDLVPEFDKLLGSNTFLDLMPEQLHSTDLQVVYDAPTWKNYITKDIKHTDDVLPTIRPFSY
jgi:hypothetical protein